MPKGIVPNQNNEYRILQAHNKLIFESLSKSEQIRLKEMGYANNGNIITIYETYQLLQKEVASAPCCFKYHKDAMQPIKTEREIMEGLFKATRGCFPEDLTFEQFMDPSIKRNKSKPKRKRKKKKCVKMDSYL